MRVHMGECSALAALGSGNNRDTIKVRALLRMLAVCGGTEFPESFERLQHHLERESDAGKREIDAAATFVAQHSPILTDTKSSRVDLDTLRVAIAKSTATR